MLTWRATWLMLLIGCHGTESPVVAEPEAATAPPVALYERIHDVQHLLAESATVYKQGKPVHARHQWARAYKLFRDDVLPSIEQTDPSLALELSYHFGRVNDQLLRRRGRPEPLADRLVRQLEVLAEQAEQQGLRVQAPTH